MTPYGSDRIETSPDGGLWLVCPAPKGWTARRGASHTSSEYAGTAIRWEQSLFEVVEAVTHPDGTVRYRLAPWEDRHLVRAIQPYDPGSESRKTDEVRSRGQSIWKRRLAILFSPVLGHLPGPVQTRMESEFGAPAIAMTVVSALPLFVIGFLGIFFSLVAAYGSGFASVGVDTAGSAHMNPFPLPLPVALYLFVESGLRMGSAFLLGQPIGSIPGALLFELWLTLTGRRPPAPLLARGLPATPEQALSDRYHLIEPLLALLSPAEQQVLADRFGLDFLRWGKRSALLLGAVGALNVVASLGMLRAGAAGVSDLVWLVGGCGFVLEQVLRWQVLSRGRPAGSVLGGAVRPLARKLLEEPQAQP